MTPTFARKLTALIGCSDEWLARSLESVFVEKRYEATRTGSGKQALKLARGGGFDVLLLDERMDDLNGLNVCAALRDDPIFDHTTPIVVISAAHSTLPSRTAAYAAGAWEYCHLPLDVDGLFLKLGTFQRAREQHAAAESKALMDSTGLYTQFGLFQVAEQLAARALRKHEAFACLAFSPQPAEAGSEQTRKNYDAGAFADVANLVREQARKSDIVAKTGDTQLSVLAPDTDAAGARLLVARLQRELEATSGKRRLGTPVRLRAGYCAVSDLAAAKVDLSELVHRAESALASLPISGDGETVVGFDEVQSAHQMPPPH
ncbi:MAG TPA: response regulator [Gemmatimonadaceae bacterium]|nr:response regulator [Gemmatimonadaceae bacterium]